MIRVVTTFALVAAGVLLLASLRHAGGDWATTQVDRATTVAVSRHGATHGLAKRPVRELINSAIPGFRSRASNAERAYHAAAEPTLMKRLAALEAALLENDIDAIARLEAALVAWFEADPSRARLLVDLAGFGPLELQCSVARLVDAVRHLDDTLAEAFIAAEIAAVAAREDKLPVSSPALQSIALDANAEQMTKATALERLMKLHGDDPGIVDAFAHLAENGDRFVRVAAIAMMTNVDHPGRAELARSYIDDPVLEVRSAALRAAAYCGEDWAAEALAAAVSEPMLARLAVAGLREYPRHSGATAALIRVARGGQVDLLPAAVAGLVHHARTNADAQAELIRISREANDASVRAEAIRGLRWSVDPGLSIEVLRVVAGQHGDIAQLAETMLASM